MCAMKLGWTTAKLQEMPGVSSGPCFIVHNFTNRGPTSMAQSAEVTLDVVDSWRPA